MPQAYWIIPLEGGGGQIDNSLPGGRPPHVGGGPVYPGGHPSGGPVYPGHPSQGLPWGPGHPSQGLPGAPAYPSQGLPEGVEVWPAPPAPGTKPVDPSEGTSVENPIAIPAPPEGAVVVVWVPGVGYRYATVTPAEPTPT